MFGYWILLTIALFIGGIIYLNVEKRDADKDDPEFSEKQNSRIVVFVVLILICVFATCYAFLQSFQNDYLAGDKSYKPAKVDTTEVSKPYQDTSSTK